MIKGKNKKIGSLLVSMFTSLAMIFSFAGVMPVMETEALTMTYTPSSSYQSSKYYSQLCSVNLGDNQIENLINVAESQYGYHEGGSSNDLSGSSSSSGNYTEYARLPGFSNPNPWCGYFISWCARQARIPESVIKTNGVASGLGSTITNGYFGNTYYPLGSITPKKGDIVYYDTDNDYVTNHVEIVYSVSSDASSISSIGGNTNSGLMVYKHQNISLSSTGSFRVLGFERPNYNGEVIPDPVNDDELGIFYPRPTGNPALKSGSAGSGVSWLQTALNKASNAGLSVDGQFGSATKTAVINFQNAYGLEADGIAGPATINKLVEVIKNGSTAEMKKPVISTDKSAYSVGDMVSLSWTASPANSNLEHYWLTIAAPDGSTIVNETMNRNTSYSFVASQAGNYTVTAFATPYGSADGSGSLTDTITVSVQNNTYTVSFYDYSGDWFVSSKTVTYGSTYGTLPTLTRDGYDFDGWYTDGIGGVRITSSSIVSTASDHKLYAQWKIKDNAPSYPVTDYYGDLDFNGRFGAGDCGILQNIISGKKTPAPVEQIYADLNGDGTINGDDLDIFTRIYCYSIDDSVVQAAFAKWKARYIDTTYVIVPENADHFELKLKQGHKYDSLPVPQKDGYTFLGWYTDKDIPINSSSVFVETDFKEVVLNNYFCIYAHWQPNEYTVYFESGEGSCATKSKTVTYGSAYGTLPVPTRPGYTFEGWYALATGINEIITSDTIYRTSGNRVLLAKWKSIQYNITFDTQSEICSFATTGKLKYGYTYGHCLGELPVPERYGYVFDGWYTEPEGGEKITEDTVITVTQDQTIYGHWILIMHKISYDTQSPACAVATTKKIIYGFTYGECLGELPVIQYRGYEFDGWYTEPEGGEKITEDSVVNVMHDQTLYAHWTSITYSINFELQAPCSISHQNKIIYGLTYGECLGGLPVPENTVYLFDGWYTEPEGGERITDNTVVTVRHDQTLYGHWYTYNRGDANNDGKVSIADAVVLQKWLSCKENLTCWKNVDLNEDGKINAFDMCLLRQMILGQE